MVLSRITGGKVVKGFRYQLSRLAVAWADRWKFLRYLMTSAIEYPAHLYLILRHWPNARLNSHWVKAQWNRELHLSMVDPFLAPLAVFDSDTDSWAHREVKAFKKGEPAVRQFFDSQGNPYHEASRRAATRLLLDVDPSNFIILVRVMRGGRLSVRDGAHRIAIAQQSGREAILVQAVPRWSLQVRGDWNRSLWRWFFTPFGD